MVLPLLITGLGGALVGALGTTALTKKEASTTYSPTTTYAPTISETISPQYAIQYTAPVIQIESPYATVESKKQQSLTSEPETKLVPTVSTIGSTQAQSQDVFDKMIPIGIIAVIGLIAYKVL